MKKLKKGIPFIVLLLVILAVVIAGMILNGHVPARKDGVEKRSAFDTSRMYVVSQTPNYDDPLQNTETRVGIDAYWKTNHRYANGIEAQLQVTKDGEIIVLSGDLSETDAESLYGKNNANVGALTLSQLQKVNLLYNVKDADGVYSFRDISDLSKPSVSVLSLSEYLELFNDGDKINALHILRFADESKISGWTSVLDKVYAAVSEQDMLSNAVLCIENDGGIKYVDDVLTDLMRAASKSELRSLKFTCRFGIEKKDLPYVLVYPDTYTFYGEEKFIHYAKNCGLAVIVPDATPAHDGLVIPQEEDVRTLRSYGVNAIATHSPQTTAELLQNVIRAEKELQVNED